MSETAPKTKQGDVIDHIDPTVSDLVCGLDIRINKLVIDCKTNNRKNNRFVPYMVDSDIGIHQEFGDWGIFLIRDKWQWCEFGGPEWWAESKRLGFSAVKAGAIGGRKNFENKTGIHAPGVQSAAGRIGGKKSAEVNRIKGTNAFFDPILLLASRKKGGEIGGKISGKITSAQRWRCLVTGFISSPGPLSLWQKARGIDTSLRERVYFVAS